MSRPTVSADVPSPSASSSAVSLALQAPESFSFNPIDWPSWKNRFQRYRRGSGLDKAAEDRQIDVLIYQMGHRAEEVFASFKPEPKKFDDALAKFDEHFIPKRNIIYERAKFLRARQGSDSAEKFITDLHCLASTCEWGNLEDDLILLVLIIGMRDTTVSDRLQLDPQLSLDKAKTALPQHEELIRQKEDLKEPESVNMVGGDKRRHKSSNFRRSYEPERNFKGKRSDGQRGKKCDKCGHDFHNFSQCPARNARCGSCRELGHYSRRCPVNSRMNVRQVHQDSSDSDSLSGFEDGDSFVGSVEKDNSEGAWSETIKVKYGNSSKKLVFKLDTAADVTMLPSNIFPNITLTKCRNNVFSAKKNVKLNIQGTVDLRLKYKNTEITEKVYVSDDIVVALLSRKACLGLNLIKRVYVVNQSTNWYEEFPVLFKGLGNVKGDYRIELKDNAQPYAIAAPRAVPVPLRKKVEEELRDMVRRGVIEPVDHATEWCAPMVVVSKKDGGIRICVDLTRLNQNVKRQYHPIPRVELSLAELGSARVYSKLDANSGFWQLNLAEESQDLTTFITPCGRFRFKKLPFGITSATEVFQRRLSMILTGCKNCCIHVDDVLVWGKDQAEHDACLRTVLERLKETGMTLNKSKCEFSVTSTQFLGFLLTTKGLKPDPKKVEAITKLDAPKDEKGVQRLIGMVNFLSRFIPGKSEILEPISSLLSSKNSFVWGKQQEDAFEQIKEKLTSAPCLKLYDVDKPTMISCDASSSGLGAVLLQGIGSEKHPVSFISRTLTLAEQGYANIEREALAVTWACERFRNYILGKQVTIETDHKPLMQIFKSKHLDDLSPRLQRFRLRMMRYDYDIVYTPGKFLLVADALSRQPIPHHEEDEELEEEVDAYIHGVALAEINTTDANIVKVIQAQLRDPVCIQLKDLLKKDWPYKSDLPVDVQEFYSVRNELCVVDGLLMRGNRMIIPMELRNIMLNKLHEGHMGITKTRRRAQGTMWWPNISSDIEKKIKGCPTCIEHSSNPHEPLLPSILPDYPWQIISMDLFKLEGHWYLVVVDHFSRFFELARMDRMRTTDVIKVCKVLFSRHGIPEKICTDSGTQFQPLQSSDFQRFAQDWGFSSSTSSPQFHQANGAAEAAVKTAKLLLKKNKNDFEKALLAYRNTPLETGFSPAELLYGRRLRDGLPFACKPNSMTMKPNLDEFLEREGRYRARYKEHYDRRHRCNELEPLMIGSFVWITDLRRHGQIVAVLKEPRSYLVKTEKQSVRRNRYHLIPAPYLEELPNSSTNLNDPPEPRSGYLSPTKQTTLSPEVQKPSPLPARKSSQFKLSSPSKSNHPSCESGSSLNSDSNPVTSTRPTPTQSISTRSGRVIVQPARYRQE